MWKAVVLQMLAILLASGGWAAEIPGSSSTVTPGKELVFIVGANRVVNDFSVAINSCASMSFIWDRSSTASISVYGTRPSDTTLGAIEASPLVVAFTADAVSSPTVSHLGYRFVIDAAETSATPSYLKVLCGASAKGGGGGVTEVAAASLPLTGDSKAIYRITDATNGGDCDNVGGGTEQADCRWNGSAYEAISQGTAGLANIIEDPTPDLGGDLDLKANDLTNTGTAGPIKIMGVIYVNPLTTGTTTAGIQEAIALCGEGSGNNDIGCEVSLPDGSHSITSTILVGGSTLATLQQGVMLVGRGSGNQGQPSGQDLAGTTLVWNGAANGTMMQLRGFLHRVERLQLDGNNTAGIAIQQIGDNSGGGIKTGKIIYDHVSIERVKGTPGVGFQFGIAGADTGQNDHTIITTARVADTNHCLRQYDGQAVQNTAVNLDCNFLVSPGVLLDRGSFAFEDLFMGTTLANATGIDLDTCVTTFVIDRGSIEWQGDNGTVVKESNRLGTCGFGPSYVRKVANVRMQFQTTATTEHTCIDKNSSASWSIVDNIWTSNNGDALRECDLELANPSGTKSSANVLTGNRAAWNNGFDTTPPAITFTDGGGGHTNNELQDGVIRLRTAGGADAIAQDATGMYVDINDDGNFDVGVDLRLTDADLIDLADGSLPLGKIGSATPDRCIRSDGAGNLTVAASDCSTGGGSSTHQIESNPSTAVLNFIDGKGTNFGFGAGDPLDIFYDLDYGSEYGNMSVAEECVFTTTGSGAGGFVCEGQTPNTFEYKFSFPLMPEASPDRELFIDIKVASGAEALTTTAIGSGACATVETASVPGALSTDRVTFSPNADISGVTGYAPVTTGSLVVYAWASADLVNFKVCNPTASSITPGAVTMNWAVQR